MANVNIQLKVVVTLEGNTYEYFIPYENGIHVNGIRFINSYDINDALKRYLLRNCDNEGILNAIVTSEYDRWQIAYNQNLSHDMADKLVDDLCQANVDGIYPYECSVIMQNPCVSKEKLDSLVKQLLIQYQYLLDINEGKADYETIYLLKHIAQNPNISKSTLEFLKNSGIPIVVKATKK